MRRRLLARVALLALAGLASLVGPQPIDAQAQEAPPTFTRLDAKQTSLTVGQRLRANAAATGAGGAAADVTWDFGDGSGQVAGEMVQHTYAAPGLYTVTIAAAVGAGPSATQSFAVVVHPRSVAPVRTAVPSERKAIPFQYVALFGEFSTGVPTVVEFRFGTVGVLVTPTLVTAGMVRVAVPPLLKKTAFAGGTATVRVIQGTGSAAVFTDAGKVKVGRLPRVTLPPGEVTKSFIRLAKGVLTDARDRIAGSALDTPGNADAIASTLNFYDAMTASVDAATGARRATGKAATGKDATAASAFAVEFSAGNVRQMDAFFAGVVAAGPRNTKDPQLTLAYESWDDAMRLSPHKPLDPDTLLALMAAEQAYRDHVRTSTDALTDGLNSVVAPFSTTTAVLGLTGLATGNPAALAGAAKLAFYTDVLTSGLVLGLTLDAAHAALVGDNFQYEVYLATAGNLTGEFATGKLLGAAVKFAGGVGADDLFGYVRDLAGAFGIQILTWQSLTQPPTPADTSITVGDAASVEGNSGSRDLVFSVRLSAPSAKTVTVKCATVDGSAAAGRDYVKLAGTTLTFAPGETERTVTVRVTGDRAREETETLLLKLSSPVGAPVVGGQAAGSILDDDWSVLTAESGSGDHLGTATGCGFTANVYLDPAAEFTVTNDGTDVECTVYAPTYSPEYGGDSYEWSGTLTWDGDTLSGSLPRIDNPIRPAATVTITTAPDGRHLLTATLPFTYYVFATDGSCDGPLHTFNHTPTALEMQED